jgi:hypothetical protein
MYSEHGHVLQTWPCSGCLHVLAFSHSLPLTLFSRNVVLSRCHSLAAFSSHSQILVLSSSRPLRFSSSRLLVLSHCRRPLALSSSRSVLSHGRSLAAFSRILRFSSSQILVLSPSRLSAAFSRIVVLSQRSLAWSFSRIRGVHCSLSVRVRLWIPTPTPGSRHPALDPNYMRQWRCRILTGAQGGENCNMNQKYYDHN